MNFDQLFPDEREKGEKGITQCHLVMLRMFKIFDYLCLKHGVRYFLCSGTLKGAILYKGFKPWDDDLDVGMTRDNYEKFVQYAVRDLPDDIFFQTPETDIYFPACHQVEAKLRDKYSSYSLMDHQKNLKYQNGIMIDIMVYDRAYLPNNYLIFLLNRSLKFLFHNRGNTPRAKVLKWISKYSPIPLVYSNSSINSRLLIKTGKNYFKASEIKYLIKTKFEDSEAFIPSGWHNYLTRKYGNYEKLPPSEKQKGHHSKDIPDAFTPCDHTEILYWKDRKINTDELLKIQA